MGLGVDIVLASIDLGIASSTNTFIGSILTRLLVYLLYLMSSSCIYCSSDVVMPIFIVTSRLMPMLEDVLNSVLEYLILVVLMVAI